MNKTTRYYLHRLLALWVDLAMGIILTSFVCSIVEKLFEVNTNILESLMLCFFIVFRDVFDRSVGKRIFKLHIIDQRSNSPASLYQRIIRNISMIIGFVELPIVLLNKDSRRLGDILAGTSVCYKPDNTKGLLK